MAKGALIAAMDFTNVDAGEFNDWYDTEHVALYHLTAPGVIDSPEWKQASGSTPMPQYVRDQISNRIRLVCRNYVPAQANR